MYNKRMPFKPNTYILKSWRRDGAEQNDWSIPWQLDTLYWLLSLDKIITRYQAGYGNNQ